MRIINMIMGVVLALLGVFSIANAGLTFISMAFPIGVILTIIGITECISYRSRDEDEEDRHWVLIDGLTTFILGIVVLTGQLAADIAVPVIFGMWSMIAGIRYLVIITHVDIKEEKNLVANEEYYKYNYTGNVSMVSENNGNKTTNYYFVWTITQTCTKAKFGA